MLDYLDAGTVRVQDSSFITRNLTRVDGLIGITAPRGQIYDRPEDNGGIEPEKNPLAYRSITIEGETWGSTIAAAYADFRTIAQAFEALAYTPGLLKWREAGGTIDKQITARLAGEVLPSLDEDDNGPFLRYQALFRAADPNHYSQTQQSASSGAPSASGGFPLPLPFPIPFGSGASGGSVTILNGGNAYAWPTITIAGPCVGPVVTVGTKTLYFDTLSLAAGQLLIIETNPTIRSATVAGASVLGSLRFADSQFGSLPPGAATNVSFYALGGGTTVATTMTVAWRDAFSS